MAYEGKCFVPPLYQTGKNPTIRNNLVALYRRIITNSLFPSTRRLTYFTKF